MAKAVKRRTTDGNTSGKASGDVASRVRRHRDKMKAAGLKPVTIWVPDVNAPGFQEKIDRAIAIINASEDEKVILEELSNVEIDGWK
ncbi:MAG: antitoxin MazE family protein [Xanthobacteraceae bacterium]